MLDVSLVHNAGCSWTTIGRHLGTVTMLTNRNVLINEQHSSKVLVRRCTREHPLHTKNPKTSCHETEERKANKSRQNYVVFM